MIYNGIYIVKCNYLASALLSNGEILIKPFKLENDADGFQLLSSRLVLLQNDSFIIVLESTVHSGDDHVCYFVINSIHTSRDHDYPKLSYINVE